ncbi:hypothetical protein GMMP15_1130011 [Candidatus Magnetomoraceae bacterium gMMP-15]
MQKEKQITIATSIAPNNLDKQKIAIQSWLNYNFKVVSFNCPEEIQTIQKIFPFVSFIKTDRNGQNKTGKPLTYLDDILQWFREQPFRFGGIVNSDIVFKINNYKAFHEKILQEIENSLLFARRIEVESLDAFEGEYAWAGIDSYFFDISILNAFPDNTDYFIGFPHWDYFMILMPLLKGFSTKQISVPFTFHVKHKQYYNVIRDGIPYSLKTLNYILPYRNHLKKRDHLVERVLDYFLKRQPGEMKSQDNLEFYYAFLSIIDKFCLESIDRNSKIIDSWER